MSVPLKPNDPAYWMLEEGRKKVESGEGIRRSSVYNHSCYICRDPEFALMGLPLCKPCAHVENGVECGAHTPADDIECDEGHTMPEYIERMREFDEEDASGSPAADDFPF